MIDNAVPKGFMWAAWVVAVCWALLSAHFLARGESLNSFDRLFDFFAAGVAIFPIVVCGGFRFWVSRFRNGWLALIPYSLGLLFAFQAAFYGIFLVPEYCIAYQVLSGILFVVYLPFFVRFRTGPPPLPKAKAQPPE